MDLKEYKRILEEESKNGDNINIKRIEKAKNKLLSNEESLEETSRLLFGLENHTIEYSIEVLKEYLGEKEKNISELSKKTDNKKSNKELFIIITILIIMLIIVFFGTLIIFSR